MRPALPAPPHAIWATAPRILNTAFLLPHPRITVKFHDWLKVKEIKVKSLRISYYPIRGNCFILLISIHFFIHLPTKNCQVPSQTSLALQGLLELQPRHWQLAEERQGHVCDGLGSTVVSLSKLVPSNPSFIQDLKKMAHTVESTQASIVPSGSGTDAAEERCWGGSERK